MILYKKGQYGLPVQTQAGNLTALQGNDSLNTNAGRETYAARGFGAPDNTFRMDVIGERMENGKRKLDYKAYGSAKGATPQARSAALLEAKNIYLKNNPSAPTTTTATPPPPPSSRINLTSATSKPVSIGTTSTIQTAPLGQTGRKSLGSYSF